MSLAIPSNFANAVAPFTPAGRQPVGQEAVDLQESTLKPLEQLPESARRENRRAPDDRPGEMDERQRLAQGPGESAASDVESETALPADEQSAREQDQARLEELKIQQEIRELASRDREVRLHEQAHAAIGGRHAGAPRYDYERGPDGVSYAVSGEVPINTSKVPNDPQATIEKAQQIRRAAYAPAEPSDTDRRVAAAAAQMEAEARVELREEALRDTATESASRPGQTQGNALEEKAADERSADKAMLATNDTAEESKQPESQNSSPEPTSQDVSGQRYAGQRHIDSYRQLVEVGTLNEQATLGSRLNQLV